MFLSLDVSVSLMTASSQICLFLWLYYTCQLEVQEGVIKSLLELSGFLTNWEQKQEPHVGQNIELYHWYRWIGKCDEGLSIALYSARSESSHIGVEQKNRGFLFSAVSHDTCQSHRWKLWARARQACFKALNLVSSHSHHWAWDGHLTNGQF